VTNKKTPPPQLRSTLASHLLRFKSYHRVTKDRGAPGESIELGESRLGAMGTTEQGQQEVAGAKKMAEKSSQIAWRGIYVLASLPYMPYYYFPYYMIE